MILYAAYADKFAMALFYFSPNKSIKVFAMVLRNSHFTIFCAEHDVMERGHFAHNVMIELILTVKI